MVSEFKGTFGHMNQTSISVKLFIMAGLMCCRERILVIITKTHKLKICWYCCTFDIEANKVKEERIINKGSIKDCSSHPCQHLSPISWYKITIVLIIVIIQIYLIYQMYTFFVLQEIVFVAKILTLKLLQLRSGQPLHPMNCLCIFIWI